MRITLINTFDLQGAASSPAYRLHKGLQQSGAESGMIVRYKYSEDKSVLPIACDVSDSDNYYFNAVQEQYIDKNRSDIAATAFSLPYPGYDLSMLPEIAQTDVINLHWTANYQSPVTLQKLFLTGKPVVWTLYDAWPFTGGCHSLAGCEKFKQDCSVCPQLANDLFGLPSAVLKNKLELTRGANITVVAPDRRLGDRAKESVLFKNCRVEVIPNGCDAGLCDPAAKSGAKKRLNIPEHTITLLANAGSGGGNTAGSLELKGVLQSCKANPDFQRLLAQGNVVLMCSGFTGADLNGLGLPAIPFGLADNDERIKDMYAAADLFFLPSREEGTSDAVIRSLRSGTPVVVFSAGDTPDIVSHGVDGIVVPDLNTEKMAEAVLNLVLSPDKRRLMGQKGSRKLAAEQSVPVAAGNYLSLFDDVLAKRAKQLNSQATRRDGDGTIPSTSGPVRFISSTGPHIQEVMLRILLKPLEDQIDNLRQQLKANEIDTAEKMDIINSLRMQKDYLETFDGSLKIMIKKILLKLGLFNFALRYRRPAARIYRLIRKRPDLNATSAKNVPVPELVTPDAAINSPLVEALVVARSLGGGLDEQSLLHYFEMGSAVENVLCVQPEDSTIQALYMLSRAGAKVTCLDWQQRSEGIRAHGFAVYEGNLADWMINIGCSTLTAYDCLILDQMKDKHEVDMLRGRLRPGTKILTSSDACTKLKKCLPSETTSRKVGSLDLFDALPSIWIDSLPEGIESYQKQDWPLRTPAIKPARLSSGRAWPRISVVTVTYNQGRYLEETIRSVLLQGYPNLEYIVIDGGSTDNTPVILDRYRHELAHCLSEKDKGQSDALNKGFRKATGEILAWLNSDDRYMPWTLWRVAHAFDIYGADMVAGGCALVHADGRMSFRTHHNAMPIGRSVSLPLDQLLDLKGSWQKGKFFYQPEVFWTRDLWERSGAHVDADLFYSMDYELWLRMARSGAQLVHVPDTLALFRIHEKQKTSGELRFLPELRSVRANFKRGMR